MQQRVGDVYYAVHRPFRSWTNPIGGKAFAGSEVKMLYHDGDQLRAYADVMKAETTGSQRAQDRCLIMAGNDCVVDVTVDTVSRLTDAALDLRDFLGVESIVQPFVLPDKIVVAINAQLSSVTRNDDFAFDTMLYGILGRIDPRITRPAGKFKTSAIFMKLNMAMKRFGMAPFHDCDGAGNKFITDSSPRTLKSGFGYRPISALAEHIHVTVPYASDTTAPARELRLRAVEIKEQADAAVVRCGGDDRPDEELCDVVTVSGTEYTEIFDRSASRAATTPPSNDARSSRTSCARCVRGC
jgi:hypothetical protein